MEYTLENEYLKLTVSSKGAEVVSVVRKCDGVDCSPAFFAQSAKGKAGCCW